MHEFLSLFQGPSRRKDLDSKKIAIECLETGKNLSMYLLISARTLFRENSRAEFREY